MIWFAVFVLVELLIILFNFQSYMPLYVRIQKHWIKSKIIRFLGTF